MNTEEKALTALAVVVERHTAHRDGYQVMVTLGTLRAIAALREARQQERQLVEGEKIVLREILGRLCDEIVVTEEHGEGADEEECPICAAIRDARKALRGDWKHSAGTGEG